MLKSSNDFIQSILSSIITEIPYNWLICEGSSEQFYFKYYFNDEIQNNRLRVVPVGGAKEIKKIYNHLAISYDELKEKIKGIVILLMDTDEQLLEFETKIIQSYIVIESSMSIKQEVKQLNLYKYHLIQKLQNRN